mgnify:CR=1 FL=1
MLPGRRDCITLLGTNGKKEKLQKKILLMTVMEAFQIFKSENPGQKIGKSKYASLCPPHVLPVSERDHTVCCCKYHENFEMLITGLKKLYSLLPGANQIVIDSVCSWNIICCFGNCEKCKNLEGFVNNLLNRDIDDDILVIAINGNRTIRKNLFIPLMVHWKNSSVSNWHPCENIALLQKYSYSKCAT